MASTLNGIDQMKHLAALGMWGDEDAIKQLLLDNVENATVPEIKEIERSTITTCLTVGGKPFVAGLKLGLNCLEHSGKNLMELAQFLGKDQLKTTIMPQIDTHDVCTKMSHLCKDAINWCKKIGEENDGRFVRNLNWYAEKLADSRNGDKETVKLLD